MKNWKCAVLEKGLCNAKLFMLPKIHYYYAHTLPSYHNLTFLTLQLSYVYTCLCILEMVENGGQREH